MIHESWVKGMRFALASKGETPHDVPDVNLNREVIPPMEKIIELSRLCSGNNSLNQCTTPLERTDEQRQIYS